MRASGLRSDNKVDALWEIVLLFMSAKTGIFLTAMTAYRSLFKARTKDKHPGQWEQWYITKVCSIALSPFGHGHGGQSPTSKNRTPSSRIAPRRWWIILQFPVRSWREFALLFEVVGPLQLAHLVPCRARGCLAFVWEAGATHRLSDLSFYPRLHLGNVHCWRDPSDLAGPDTYEKSSRGCMMMKQSRWIKAKSRFMIRRPSNQQANDELICWFVEWWGGLRDQKVFARGSRASHTIHRHWTPSLRSSARA